MKKLITSFLILFCQFVSADPADELSEILKKSISFQGNFHQRVVDDDGFLIGARILNRTKTFEGFPEVKVVGGGGYGGGY